MARRNNIRAKAKSGLGALPKKGIRDRKIGGGFMPQPRPRPMPMPIARPPQMIQPMPINRPMPMPISGRPPILNKGPGSGPMPIQGGRPPAPILGGNDFLPNPGFGVAPVGTPQPNFNLEALRGIPNQTNFPMPGGQRIPMMPNETSVPFTPPGMEGIQEAINQQLPFGNLGSGLPGGQQPIPMMPNETSVPFNPNRPGIDPRQMPISIGRIGGGLGNEFGGQPLVPGTGTPPPQTGLGAAELLGLSDEELQRYIPRESIGQGVGASARSYDTTPSPEDFRKRLQSQMDLKPGDRGYGMLRQQTYNPIDSSPPSNQGPTFGRPDRQPISIGGPGGGITSIGQPLDGNTPGLPRLPGGPNQPKPVELMQLDVYSCGDFDPTDICKKIMKDFDIHKIEYKYLNRETGLVDL